MAELLPRRGFVGLQVAASERTDPGGPGLYVRTVAAGSAAASAGALAGDRLLRIDENPAYDLNEVRRILRALQPGDPLLLTVLRAGQELTLESVVERYPTERHRGARVLLDQVRNGNHWLRAIAVIPEAPGPHPTVYYLPGAHWASEEYPFQSDHPLPTLLGELARAGVASLRVERSGIGDSQGDACTRVDFETELAGYRAGLEWLTRAEWAAREQLFLFGHSIGAMVAPLLAREVGVRGIVTFGASALPLSDGLVGALIRFAELQPGHDLSHPERLQRVAELVRLVVCEGRTPTALFLERPDAYAVAPAHFRGDEIYGRTVSFFHQLEQQNIAEAWRELAVPVLALHGARDWISTHDDSRVIAELAGPLAELRQLPDTDHHLASTREGSQPRLSPVLRDVLLAWLGRQTYSSSGHTQP